VAPTEGHPDLVIRPVVEDDLDQVAELYAATRRDAFPLMPPPVPSATEIRERFGRAAASNEIWVAEDEDLAGFAMIDGDWLHSLYVGPDRQGLGIGTALLDLVKARRPDGFGLWVFASNDKARGFYRRHGLVELEHTDGSANEERSPDVQMAWPGQIPIQYLRSAIDVVDDEIALLLSRRFALTSSVQGFKEQGGQQGRDPDRERQIAERMAAHAPGLGAAAIGRIMHTVIDESLDAYDAARSTGIPGVGTEVGTEASTEASTERR
jgi:chorismate mutase/ribosomal protein S18 acetylase RimI-like enzyme